MGNIDPAKWSMNRCRVQLCRSLPAVAIAAAVVMLSVLTLTSRLLVGSQNAPSQQLPIVANASSECAPHPLLSLEVDPANYEYGCKDFEDMLQGNKTFVGQGQIRDVWLVNYKGRALVVKPLRVDEPQKQRQLIRMHRSEIAALDSVRGHLNIVGMLGICQTTIATDYHSEFLNQRILSGPHWTTGLSISTIMTMARDAARGLQALHEAAGGPIVHFDMKPQQVLLTEDGRVKLNDLNRAQFMGTNAGGHPCPFKSGRASRPSSWVAPEKIAWQPLTEKTDIYSMGMIFYSLVSGKEPFGQTEIDKERLLQRIMPHIDPSWHQGYMELVQDMWQREPAERPSARQVVDRLEDLLCELST